MLFLKGDKLTLNIEYNQSYLDLIALLIISAKEILLNTHPLKSLESVWNEICLEAIKDVFTIFFSKNVLLNKAGFPKELGRESKNRFFENMVKVLCIVLGKGITRILYGYQSLCPQFYKDKGA